jgi:hypothetical protein
VDTSVRLHRVLDSNDESPVIIRHLCRTAILYPINNLSTSTFSAGYRSDDTPGDDTSTRLERVSDSNGYGRMVEMVAPRLILFRPFRPSPINTPGNDGGGRTWGYIYIAPLLPPSSTLVGRFLNWLAGDHDHQMAHEPPQAVRGRSASAWRWIAC